MTCLMAFCDHVDDIFNVVFDDCMMSFFDDLWHILDAMFDDILITFVLCLTIYDMMF